MLKLAEEIAKIQQQRSVDAHLAATMLLIIEVRKLQILAAAALDPQQSLTVVSMLENDDDPNKTGVGNTNVHDADERNM